MRIVSVLATFCLAAIGCQPKGTIDMKKPITNETLRELQGYIQQDVAAGFRPEGAIATNAAEILADEYDAGELMPHAIRLTRELIALHRREQESWPKITDCDRLDAAFAELEEAGVICRQDFSCCGTCGAGEIRDVMEELADGGKIVRGYAFYHSQDTDSAVIGNGLHLNYGAHGEAEDEEAAALAIGGEIASTLARQGLAVDWDGTWNRRIGVKLDWKRRR